MKICTFCNFLFDDNENVCRNCGRPLVPAVATQPQPTYPPQPVQPPVTETKAETSAKKGFPAWVIAVIVAAAVLLVGGGILIGVFASGGKDSVDAGSDSADSYYDEDADEDADDDVDDIGNSDDTITTAPSGDNTPENDNAPQGGEVTNKVEVTQSNNSTDPAVVLAKYTSVMNQLKTGMSKYEKFEYQTLSDDYDLGVVGNLVLPIAQNLMTDESEAAIEYRTDMEQIPVIHNSNGCLLTDSSKIKSASMTENGGKTTIVIVLKDEANPYPAEKGATYCGSAVGAMFNPIDQDEIDDIVAEFSGVVTMNKFAITAKDCTATLVFDTATGEVESLEQVMNYYIDVDAKAVVVPVSGYATLINTMKIYNVEY